MNKFINIYNMLKEFPPIPYGHQNITAEDEPKKKKGIEKEEFYGFDFVELK